MKQVLIFPKNLNKKDGGPVAIDALQFWAKARFEANYATFDYCGEVVRVNIYEYQLKTLSADEAAALVLEYHPLQASETPAQAEPLAVASVPEEKRVKEVKAPAEKPKKDNAKLKEYTALKKFAKEKGIKVPKGTSLEDLKKLLEESK